MKFPFPKFKFSKGVRFVIISDNEGDARHWSLTPSSLVSISILIVVLCSALLFFSSDFLTKILYQSRLKEVRRNNQEFITLLNELQEKVNDLEFEIGEIEEKDRALRTYADLPSIDKDIRRLGVGGLDANRRSELDDLFSDVGVKISKLEIDIDNLYREIRLEKESYETIYDAIRLNKEKFSSVPSIRPVRGGYLKSGFGYRRDPLDGERRFHYGQDISESRGSPVFAAADGKVVYAGYNGSFGKTIKINHGHGYQTIYAHLNKIRVKSRQELKRGDYIGDVGSTGRSTAPHLHYEVRYYGTPQDPKNYFFTGFLK
ncbi:MAG: peptidoglycan DD-metalloendopeptidase family protein [Candidatus Marinimicrobia bacterium]|nr:peptidoglycan DD-metalloendopeptidase family protein [Candidatus Neomarinimicrobiota bacterium]